MFRPFALFSQAQNLRLRPLTPMPPAPTPTPRSPAHLEIPRRNPRSPEQMPRVSGGFGVCACLDLGAGGLGAESAGFLRHMCPALSWWLGGLGMFRTFRDARGC